jgi:hypothetical protein
MSIYLSILFMGHDDLLVQVGVSTKVGQCVFLLHCGVSNSIHDKAPELQLSARQQHRIVIITSTRVCIIRQFDTFASIA